MTRQHIMSHIGDMSDFPSDHLGDDRGQYLSYRRNVKHNIGPQKSLRAKLDIRPNVRGIFVPYPEITQHMVRIPQLRSELSSGSCSWIQLFSGSSKRRNVSKSRRCKAKKKKKKTKMV